MQLSGEQANTSDVHLADWAKEYMKDDISATEAEEQEPNNTVQYSDDAYISVEISTQEPSSNTEHTTLTLKTLFKRSESPIPRSTVELLSEFIHSTNTDALSNQTWEDTQITPTATQTTDMDQDHSKTFDLDSEFPDFDFTAPSFSWDEDFVTQPTNNAGSDSDTKGIDPRHLRAPTNDVARSTSSYSTPSHYQTPGHSPFQQSSYFSVDNSHLSSASVSPMLFPSSYDDPETVTTTINTLLVSNGDNPEDNGPNEDGSIIDDPMGGDSKTGDKPYNEWLYQCLRAAPNHEMELHDIYQWFRDNTPKGGFRHEKAWQNSIRHNLSMNEAFVRASASDLDGTKKAVWRLTDETIAAGTIEPTTRYRKSHDRSLYRHNHIRGLDKTRQRAGAAGGYAASKWSASRKSPHSSSGPGPIRHGSAPARSHGMMTRARATTPITPPTMGISAPGPTASAYSRAHSSVFSSASAHRNANSSGYGSSFQTYQASPMAQQTSMNTRYPSFSNANQYNSPYFLSSYGSPYAPVGHLGPATAGATDPALFTRSNQFTMHARPTPHRPGHQQQPLHNGLYSFSPTTAMRIPPTVQGLPSHYPENQSQYSPSPLPRQQQQYYTSNPLSLHQSSYSTNTSPSLNYMSAPPQPAFPSMMGQNRFQGQYQQYNPARNLAASQPSAGPITPGNSDAEMLPRIAEDELVDYSKCQVDSNLADADGDAEFPFGDMDGF